MRCQICPSRPALLPGYTTSGSERTYTYTCPLCARTQRRTHTLTPARLRPAAPHTHTAPPEAFHHPANPGGTDQ